MRIWTVEIKNPVGLSYRAQVNDETGEWEIDKSTWEGPPEFLQVEEELLKVLSIGPERPNGLPHGARFAVNVLQHENFEGKIVGADPPIESRHVVIAEADEEDDLVTEFYETVIYDEYYDWQAEDEDEYDVLSDEEEEDPE